VGANWSWNAPRLHDGVPLLRPSERGTFLECEWRWDKEYVGGWRGPHVPTWSWFGTAMHKGLEVRYPVGRRRGSIADTIDAFEEAVGTIRRRVYTEGVELDEVEVVDGVALGKDMLKAYCLYYGQDRNWEVIHSEQTFQIEIPKPKTHLETILAIMCGTWDMVVWDRVDRVFRIVDHKTRRSFPAFWTFYDHHGQAGSYLYSAPEVLRHKGIFEKGDRLEGIVFNALRKKMQDPRPRNAKGESLNKDGTVSKQQPAEYFYRYTSHRDPRQRVSEYRHIVREALRMKAIRDKRAKALKHRTENCPHCPLFDPCMLDEQDPAAAQHMLRTLYVQRDPYADHREAMEQGGLHLEAGALHGRREK
jgi:hypothetical protein